MGDIKHPSHGGELALNPQETQCGTARLHFRQPRGHVEVRSDSTRIAVILGHGKCVQQENLRRYLLGSHGAELDAIGGRGMITWWFQGHFISMLFATLLGMIATDYFGPFRICQGLEITNQTTNS